MTTLSEKTVADILALAKDVEKDVTQGCFVDFRQDNNLDKKPPHVELTIRHYGSWVMPNDSGDEDDGDYDWEELSQKSGVEFGSMLKDFTANYSGIKSSWNTGEKNHIYVIIQPVA